MWHDLFKTKPKKVARYNVKQNSLLVGNYSNRSFQQEAFINNTDFKDNLKQIPL